MLTLTLPRISRLREKNLATGNAGIIYHFWPLKGKFLPETKPLAYALKHEPLLCLFQSLGQGPGEDISQDIITVSVFITLSEGESISKWLITGPRLQNYLTLSYIIWIPFRHLLTEKQFSTGQPFFKYNISLFFFSFHRGCTYWSITSNDNEHFCNLSFYYKVIE